MAPEIANPHEFQAELRFYEELNDFLKPFQRKQPIPFRFDGKPSVKFAIEALGVPHTEVDLILVNGVSVAFDHRLVDGDRVSVYPVFESLDITPLVRLRPEPLRRPAFVLDVHLGKLVRRLRLLGFDCLYRNDYADPEIVALAAAENRIILTRDRRLLHAKSVTHGYWVRSAHADTQVREVLDRFDLRCQIRPFTRCSRCNGMIAPVDKAAVLYLLEPKTRMYYEIFYRCRDCGQIYWEGSHLPNLLAWMESFRLADNP
ncbi:MAG: Mut7-C RNAse domain-containing protein [Thermodesulfobacteriota bacterium]